MVRYDSSIIYRFGDALEARARFLFWSCILGFTVVGALVCFVYWGSASIFSWLGTAAAAVVGAMIGSDLAFRVRIALHTMLCQVQIEENTRAASVPLDDRPLTYR